MNPIIIDHTELYSFPENIKDIERKSQASNPEITLGIDLEYLKNIFEKHSSFGNHILEYGIALLEHKDLVKAGKILSQVCRAENWDNMWPYALLHKARIAALLGEVEYMLEFLQQSFRVAAYFKDVCGGDEKFKEMAKNLTEFHKNRDYPRFKQVLTYEYLNKEDYDKTEEDWNYY